MDTNSVRAAITHAKHSATWSESSTAGRVKLQLPLLDALDLGFQLPDAPKTALEAESVIRHLIAPGGLPTHEDYAEFEDGLRQNRLVHAILSLLISCLDQWSLAHPDEATYPGVGNAAGRRIRKYQLSPLPICFKNAASRDANFNSWFNTLDVDVRKTPAVQDFMLEEKRAYGTIDEVTASHRANSYNLYMVVTQDHPVYGQSFGVRLLRGTEHYDDVLNDDIAREEHYGRGGTPHEFAVLIDNNHRAYVYDPSFDPSDWSEGRPKRLGNAACLWRAAELLKKLRVPGGREPKLNKEITLGGGGNMGNQCRIMTIQWIVQHVAQWMGICVGDSCFSASQFASGSETVSLKM